MSSNERRHRSIKLGIFLLPLLVLFSGCEYVRPTLNAPLKHLDPAAGYRWANLMRPEEGNSDSLFVMAAFSGGGTRASTLAFGVSSEREASVVVLGLFPRRVMLVSPSQPATGAIERIRPGGPTVLADRPTLVGPPGTVRFLAVFCKSALPPDTVLKAGRRALAAAQGDPDGVRTLDLGCGEAFASARIGS